MTVADFMKSRRESEESCERDIQNLERKIRERRRLRDSEISEIERMCHENGGHEDDGGMFYSQCRKCGFSDDFYGGD